MNRQEFEQWINTPQPVKEGHKEALLKDIQEVAVIARGKLGWSGQAKMMVMLGLDRGILNLKTKNKRIREKHMKRVLKDMMMRNVLKHIEGFDDEGYRIERGEQNV